MPSTAQAAAVSRGNGNAGMEALVRDYFADIPVMIEIARCESEFTQFGKSGKPLHGGTGTMIGLFQISEILHGDIADRFGWDIDTPQGNMAYARYLYEQSDTRPWLASKHCWNAPKAAARWQAATDALAKTASSTGQRDDVSSLAFIQDQLVKLLAKVSQIQADQQKVASATI